MRLDFNAFKLIQPDKVRTMKELNADLDMPLTAYEMVLKVITSRVESSADYIIEVTGLSGSQIQKTVAKLINDNLISKELRSAKPGQSGNGKRAYFSKVVNDVIT